MRTQSVRKRALAIMAGLTLAVTSVIMSAPAQALVYNCTTGYNANGWAFAKCLSAHNPSTERYRVAVLCRNAFWESHVVYGDAQKVTSGQPSTIQGCPAFEWYYGTPWSVSA